MQLILSTHNFQRSDEGLRSHGGPLHVNLECAAYNMHDQRTWHSMLSFYICLIHILCKGLSGSLNTLFFRTVCTRRFESKYTGAIFVNNLRHDNVFLTSDYSKTILRHFFCRPYFMTDFKTPCNLRQVLMKTDFTTKICRRTIIRHVLVLSHIR